MRVHPLEEQLLKMLRQRWRFGEVIVLMRDGLPRRILKAYESEDFE